MQYLDTKFPSTEFKQHFIDYNVQLNELSQRFNTLVGNHALNRVQTMVETEVLQFDPDKVKDLGELLKMPTGDIVTGDLLAYRMDILQYLAERNYCFSNLTLGSIFKCRCILLMLFYPIFNASDYLRQMFAANCTLDHPKIASSMRLMLGVMKMLQAYGQDSILLI